MLQTVMVHCGTLEFLERSKVIDDLISLWSNKQHAAVIEKIVIGEENVIHDNISTESDPVEDTEHLNKNISQTINDTTHTDNSTESDPVEDTKHLNKNISQTINDATHTDNSTETDPAENTDLLENSIGNENESTDPLKDIVFAHRIKKRGRPRGGCTTAIGLPKLKRKKKDGPIPFHQKDFKAKQEQLLHWVTVNEDIVVKAM